MEGPTQRELFDSQEAVITQLVKQVRTLSADLENKLASIRADELLIEDQTAAIEDLKVRVIHVIVLIDCRGKLLRLLNSEQETNC